MITRESFIKQLPHLNNENFNDFALQLFQYQYRNNSIYRKYTDNLGVSVAEVHDMTDIPFLPIDFFKKHKVTSLPTDTTFEKVYESSGTTGMETSKHYIADEFFYLEHSQRLFEAFYGPLNQFVILAMLPSYAERKNASLIAMIDHFIAQTGDVNSGYYLYDQEALLKQLSWLKGNTNKKVLLWGVTFALMDLAEQHQLDLSGIIMMETGGMKGRRKELTRMEVHAILEEKFNVRGIHSEYGMTELLSQSYSRGEGLFVPSRSMRVLYRDPNDPLDKRLSNSRYGGLNVIDLANIDSCAFIETQDLGKVNDDGTFEVFGRFDNSDLRGCNLMVL
jgi:hypothetical protein